VHGGTLKGQSLVFKRKQLGRSRINGRAFDMNHDSFRTEQDDPRQAKRDQACKQTGRLFVGVYARHNAAKLLARFDAAM
jgi:hypothetical protein